MKLTKIHWYINCGIEHLNTIQNMVGEAEVFIYNIYSSG